MLVDPAPFDFQFAATSHASAPVPSEIVVAAAVVVDFLVGLVVVPMPMLVGDFELLIGFELRPLRLLIAPVQM